MPEIDGLDNTRMPTMAPKNQDKRCGGDEGRHHQQTAAATGSKTAQCPKKIEDGEADKTKRQ